MKVSEFNNLTIKEAATWYYDFGTNPIPINPKLKKPFIKWEQWQHERMPREYFEELCNKYFNKNNSVGIALITGKLYDKNKKNYLVAVDADNLAAVEPLRTTIDGRKLTFEDFTKGGIIAEGHSDNYNKIHLLYLCSRPVRPLSSTKSDNPNVPAFEIKSTGETYIIVPPSFSDTGIKRQVIAYPDQDLIFNYSNTLDKRIDQILSEYEIPYLSNSGNGNYNKNTNDIPIADLFKEDFVIYEGHNRHKALLRVMDSLIRRNYKIFGLDKIKDLSQGWNQEHCIPPLDNKEFEKQWKQASQFIGKQIAIEDQLEAKLNELVEQNKNKNNNF